MYAGGEYIRRKGRVMISYKPIVKLSIFVLVTMLSTTVLREAKAQPYVFAHYMVTNQDYQGNTSTSAKVAAYEKEMQQAYKKRRY